MVILSYLLDLSDELLGMDYNQDGVVDLNFLELYLKKLIKNNNEFFSLKPICKHSSKGTCNDTNYCNNE